MSAKLAMALEKAWRRLHGLLWRVGARRSRRRSSPPSGAAHSAGAEMNYVKSLFKLRSIAAGWRLRAMSLESAGMMVAPSMLRECAEEVDAALDDREPMRTSWYKHESAAAQPETDAKMQQTLETNSTKQGAVAQEPKEAT